MEQEPDIFLYLAHQLPHPPQATKPAIHKLYATLAATAFFRKRSVSRRVELFVNMRPLTVRRPLACHTLSGGRHAWEARCRGCAGG